MRILPNVTYQFEATGNWSTSPDGPLTDARGDADGLARLVGVIQREYRLYEPFDLGTSGSFVSPVSGNLYVRCSDSWNELADNRGHVRLTIRRP